MTSAPAHLNGVETTVIPQDAESPLPPLCAPVASVLGPMPSLSFELVPETARETIHSNDLYSIYMLTSIHQSGNIAYVRLARKGHPQDALFALNKVHPCPQRPRRFHSAAPLCSAGNFQPATLNQAHL